jgi:S1-C subfamily serine protease
MINASGELIGVIDYKLINGTEGISFAIPAHTVQKLMGLKYE